MTLQFSAKIYVAGHRGLAGGAIMRALRAAGCTNFVLRTHSELELVDRDAPLNALLTVVVVQSRPLIPKQPFN